MAAARTTVKDVRESIRNSMDDLAAALAEGSGNQILAGALIESAREWIRTADRDLEELETKLGEK